MHRYASADKQIGNAICSTSADKQTDNANFCTCCPTHKNYGMYYNALNTLNAFNTF